MPNGSRAYHPAPGSGLPPAAPPSQKQVPPPHRYEQNKSPDHDSGPHAGLLLLQRAGADADHHPGDLGARVCFGGPHPVAIGIKDEFALGVGVAGLDRRLQITRCENSYCSIGHRLAVRGCELGRDLMRGKEVESASGRFGERARRQGRQQQHRRSAREHRLSEKSAAKLEHAINIAMFRARATVGQTLSLLGSARAWQKPLVGGAMPNFAIERRCEGIVCGIDEAGRGPLAGPVVAAAVILDPRRFPRSLHQRLDDSKVLTAGERDACWRALGRCVDRGVAKIGVGAASAREIDSINILRAALLAMARAVAALGVRPDVALVDGNIAPPLACPVQTIVKGDGLSFSIAAASVVAKVTRDRIMRALAQRYRGYGWETNVGYGTREHGDAILKFGPTPHHRRSFAPVRLALAGELSLFAALSPATVAIAESA
jgi:ribonuclease HII